MNRQLITNCRLITTYEIVHDCALLIEDGRIAAIEPVNTKNAQIFDLGSMFIMPGMIDLHCDALEKEIEPRPNVFFPTDFAIAQADRRNAQAGITTIFHALSFAHGELGVRSRDMAAKIARQVCSLDQTIVDNRVHGRYEITDPESLSVLCDLMGEKNLHFISIMDHTPGQGQFKEMTAYRGYLERTYGKSTKEAEKLIQVKIDNGKDAFKRVKQLTMKANECGIRIASHDDDSPGRVQTMSALGSTVSEFPVNYDTAKVASDMGLWTVFGAPNILRGASQSGSMKAVDAVKKKVAGCLCSDYHPGTLLASVFQLPKLLDISLVEAVRLVTINPAKAAGYEDRGSIKVGKRADLVGVTFRKEMPHVSYLWVKGKITYYERSI